MVILGIDPGTATTGFGVLEYDLNNISVLDFGLIETKNNTNSGKRLIEISKEITVIIKKYKPDVISLEKLFFATNAKTAMSVGQAIGVIIFTIVKNKVEFFEYAPGTIKKKVTGDGRADKKMIQRSLRKLLGGKIRSRVHGKTHFDNSADALAVALCHIYNIRES